MSTQRVCDRERCGNFAVAKNPEELPEGWGYLEIGAYSYDVVAKELCPECMDALQRFLKGYAVNGA